MTSGLSPAGNPYRQQEVQKLAARYQEHGKNAIKPDTSPEQALEQIKAESYAHIMGHEQAHKSAAGAYGGSIAIEYDNNGVAIAGHVPINIPALDSKSPESGLKAYQTIYNAALAPGDPSGQDKAVASQALSLMGQAQVLMDQKRNGQRKTGHGGLPFFQPE